MFRSTTQASLSIRRGVCSFSGSPEGWQPSRPKDLELPADIRLVRGFLLWPQLEVATGDYVHELTQARIRIHCVFASKPEGLPVNRLCLHRALRALTAPSGDQVHVTRQLSITMIHCCRCVPDTASARIFPRSTLSVASFLCDESL